MPAVASIETRRAARLAPSRIADTRVLCASADTVCDNMLSVADEVMARPVHDRARSVDTQRAARPAFLELSSGEGDVVVILTSSRGAAKECKKIASPMSAAST